MNAKKPKLNTTPDGELACANGEPWMGEHPICERETNYSICVSEEEVIDLAAGYAPKTVVAMARMLIETDDDRCRRNAAKPMKPRTGGRRPTP